MTFELKVKVVGPDEFVWFKSYAELDAIPDTSWIFTYGPLELNVQHILYDPVLPKVKAIRFAPVKCEDLEEFADVIGLLKDYGWQEIGPQWK